MTEFLPTLTVAGVLGVVAPLLANVLNRLTFGPQVKQLIAVATAVLMAFFAIIATDGFDKIPGKENPAVWLCTLILVVIAISQLAFQLIWRPTGIADKVALATATKAEKAEIIDARNSVDGPVATITNVQTGRGDAPTHRAE